MKYKLINLRTPERILAESNELADLFRDLDYNHIIVSGRKQEIVAGKPTAILDTMQRDGAHTLPELLEALAHER